MEARVRRLNQGGIAGMQRATVSLAAVLALAAYAFPARSHVACGVAAAPAAPAAASAGALATAAGAAGAATAAVAPPARAGAAATCAAAAWEGGGQQGVRRVLGMGKEGALVVEE